MSIAAEIINAAAMKKAAPRIQGTRVIADLPVFQQLERVGGNLTPLAVSTRLGEADQGKMAGLVDLANALRQKDNHLQGVLETRESAVQRLEWELELPRKASRKEKKAAAFVEDALRNVLDPLIAQCSSAPFYGYAVTEAIYRKSGKYIVPETFVPVAHRRFVYTFNQLLWSDPLTDAPVDIQTTYPGKFVVSRPRINGDVPCREGLMRVLVWPALFRTWTVTDWLRLGEIAWRPWRIGKYKRDSFAQQEDIDGLITLLDGMSTSGVAVIPDSVEIDVQWPASTKNGKGAHSELFSTMGREISKAVLGQTETTESSYTSGYAQAKTMDGIRKDKVESDARFIAGDITRDLITWLVRWNFGEGLRTPSLRFITAEATDLKAFGAAVTSFVAAGLRVPAKWVRDKAGIPHPADGEEILASVPTAIASHDDEESSDAPALPSMDVAPLPDAVESES